MHRLLLIILLFFSINSLAFSYVDKAMDCSEPYVNNIDNFGTISEKLDLFDYLRDSVVDPKCYVFAVNMLEKAVNSGFDSAWDSAVEKDDFELLNTYVLAATALGQVYLDGRLIDKVDHHKAHDFFKRVFDIGNAGDIGYATYALGRIAQLGLIDAPDNEAAAWYYFIAMNKDYVLAGTALANLIYDSNMASLNQIHKDEVKHRAFAFHLSAALSGSAESQCKIALLYPKNRMKNSKNEIDNGLIEHVKIAHWKKIFVNYDWQACSDLQEMILNYGNSNN